MSDIFEEVAQENAWACERLEIEPGFQMPSGVKGICIEIQESEAPIFISAAQLRALADAVESQ